jgi:hypothetical protein
MCNTECGTSTRLIEESGTIYGINYGLQSGRATPTVSVLPFLSLSYLSTYSISLHYLPTPPFVTPLSLSISHRPLRLPFTFSQIYPSSSSQNGSRRYVMSILLEETPS